MRISYIIILIILPFLVFSQTKDVENWNNIQLKYSIFKKSHVIIDNGVRWSQNSDLIEKYFIDFSLYKKYSDLFKMGSGYRYGYNRIGESNKFNRFNRYYIDLIFNFLLIEELKVDFRNRMQSQTNLDFSNNQNITFKVRNRLKFNYDFNNIKFNIFFYTESFHLPSQGLDKLRYALGFVKNIYKNFSFKLQYMLEREVLNEKKNHILYTKIIYRF